jgi:hypothetical protein
MHILDLIDHHIGRHAIPDRGNLPGKIDAPG